MELWDIDKACLAYVLSDTPRNLIDNQIFSLQYKFEPHDPFQVKLYEKMCEDIENSHDFSKIPESSRVKLYYINRDKEAMEQVKEKVNSKEVKEFYNNLKL